MKKISTNKSYLEKYENPTNFNVLGKEYRNIEFTNNIATIDHHPNFYEPTKIMCYNISNDFSINSIKLKIANDDIITIDDINVLNNIVNFIEDINIDGNIYKTYYLDKTKLFFEIKTMLIPYYEIKFVITTSGNCQKIILNGIYTDLQRNTFNFLRRVRYNELIKTLYMGTVKDYESMQEIKLYMTGKFNGFILTNINPNMINKIRLQHNGNMSSRGFDILNCSDKYNVMMNTTKINDNTIYINLNNSSNSYISDINENSYLVNDDEYIKLIIGLDDGYSNVNFNILSYSNTIITYYNDMMDWDRYYYKIKCEIKYQNQNGNWKIENKIIKPGTICPVLKSEIFGDYIICGKCNHSFDIMVKTQWIKEKKTCPLCRGIWKNFTIYQNKTSIAVL